MKRFFKEHSYDMVKMFLNQFATSIFGFVLTLATSRLKNPGMRTVLAVFSVLFYLFLLYIMTWEIGFSHRASIERGTRKKNIYTGTLISLCANSVNFLLAISIMLAMVTNVELLSSIGASATMAVFWLEGMYSGFMPLLLFGNPLNSYWLFYFLMPLPAIGISTLSYILGLKDIKFTKLFDPVTPESDREPKHKG